MEKRLTMILASLFLCVGMAVAQTAVTGTVLSQEDGQPVVGATVRVEGSNAGTVTDVDGKFSVNAPSDAYLTVTYIGMKEARVKAGRNLRIVMENDDNALDELVVTGYGSARKLGTIAGSVATVSSEAISNRPVANVGDALQGQVAGLQVFTSSGEPSATTSMRIRGVTSIYATTEPMSREIILLFLKVLDTSLFAIFIASPSAIADFPTPGSPISTGLFFFLLPRIWASLSISFSRPTTGSSLSSAAARVKS